MAFTSGVDGEVEVGVALVTLQSAVVRGNNNKPIILFWTNRTGSKLEVERTRNNFRSPGGSHFVVIPGLSLPPNCSPNLGE